MDIIESNIFVFCCLEGKEDIMARRKHMTDAEKTLLIEEGKVARRHKMLKTSMKIAGFGLIVGATLVVATKKILTRFSLRMTGQM